MKRVFSVLAATVLAVAAFAQTPKEIVDRMEAAMNAHESEGVIIMVDVKIPILGTMSTKTYSLGDKTFMLATIKGKEVHTWSDGTTEWTWIPSKNELTIDNDSAGSSEAGGDAEMLEGITDGYDLSITKETEEAWYIKCKRSKSNPDKDAPKSMDLVVAKATYYPLSLKFKDSGITMTLHDFEFGVSEKQVTFNQADYPNATIVDKRK